MSRSTCRRVLPILLLGMAGAGLAAPVAIGAPTATAQGGVATFADPDGVGAGLAVTLARASGASVDPQGYNVAFFQVSPSVVPGGGCQAGLVGVLCPFGAAAPSGITVDAGGGDDEVTLEVAESAAPTAAAISIKGGAGNDRLTKVRAKATMDGGDGDDVLLPDELRPFAAVPGPTPGDRIVGGAGNDTVTYESTPSAVNVSLDGVANDGRPGEGDEVDADVENVVGPLAGSVLTGSAIANRLTGSAGADTLTGLAGRDTLIGGGGNDTINATDGEPGDAVTCGDGDDLVFADAGDVVEAAGCETVAWTPRLTSRTLGVRGGRLRVGLLCPAQARGCQGILVVRSAGGSPATIARSRYAVRSGKRATLSLRLTKAGRKAVGRRRLTRASAVLALDGGPAPTGPAVTLKQRR